VSRVPDEPIGGRVAAIVSALRDTNLLVSDALTAPVELAGICDDSRAVVPGGLFVAVRGSALDGHEFIAAARSSGAALVIAEDAARASGGPALIVRDARRAAAVAAAAFYRQPGAGVRLVAVTGTNGKTTTVGMLRHLLDDGATRAASIGTLGVLFGSEGAAVDGGAGLTTPGPIELQRVLRVLADRGARFVAMEVSSHSLAQHRIEGVRFDAAVFTNLTRDHLDYHGTMDAYRDAKLSLAMHLAPEAVAIVNADEPAWGSLASQVRTLTFGAGATADVRAEDIDYGPEGTRFRLVTPGGTADVMLPLIGDFNVSNALGAVAAATELGVPTPVLAARIATMPQVVGRLERIGAQPTVLRDYAHTPDALERALLALRPFVRGRIIVVFGAGGDRDPGKRPLMGAVAARLADVAIVTSDNPRTEDPERIIDAIVSAMPVGGYERIEDRREAIARAIAIADSANDLVLLAGKGHETYQVRGTAKLPFDEAEIAAELMTARSNR